jgi:hypothetical protein
MIEKYFDLIVLRIINFFISLRQLNIRLQDGFLFYRVSGFVISRLLALLLLRPRYEPLLHIPAVLRALYGADCLGPGYMLYYLLTTPGSWREVLAKGVTPVIRARPEAVCAVQSTKNSRDVEQRLVPRTEEEQSEETRDDESGDSIEEKPILKANIELPQ